MEFTRSQIPVVADLDAIERITSDPLAESIRSAYMRLSGYTAPGIGFPITLSYSGDFESDDLLQRFLDADEIKEQWPYIDYLADYAATFGLGLDFFDPTTLLPIADCANGAIYVANTGQHAGKVYHADNGDFGVALVAPDITLIETAMGFILR